MGNEELKQYLLKAMADPRAQKALKVIQQSEGTSQYQDPYSVAGGGKVQLQQLDQHPGQSAMWGFTQTDGKKNTSSAAGAYQYTRKTWDGVQAALGLPDFGKDSQDIGALYLMHQSGALDDILNDRPMEGFRKAAGTWASLPDSPYPQHKRSHDWLRSALDVAEDAPAEQPAEPDMRVPAYQPVQSHGDLWSGFDSAQKADQAQVERGLSQSLSDSIHAAFRTTPINEFIIGQYNSWYPAQEGFVPDEQRIADGKFDAYQRAQLYGARSEEEFNGWYDTYTLNREYAKDLAAAGGGQAMAAGLLAGVVDPANLLFGVGTMKAMATTGYGAIRAARMGNYAAARMSAIGENVIGAAAQTAVESVLQDHFSVADGVLNAGVAAVFGGLSGHAVVRGQQATVERETAAYAAWMHNITEKAKANLGDDAADPVKFAAELKRVEAEEVNKLINGIIGPEPPDDPTILRRQKTEAELAQEAADARTAAINEKWNAPEELSARAKKHIADGDASRALALGRGDNNKMHMDAGTTDGKRVWYEMTRNEISWEDVQKLPAGVHVLPTVANHEGAALAVQVVKDLAEKYMPGKRIVFGAQSYDLAYESNGTAWQVGDTMMIAVDTVRTDVTPQQRARAMVHEFGHILWYEHMKTLPPGLKNKILNEWSRVASRIAQEKKGNWIGRYSISSEWVTTMNHDAEQLKGYKLPLEGDNVSENKAYARNLDEYTAEQFVKHIEKMVLDGDKDIPASFIDTLKELMAKVLAMFSEARGKRLVGADDGIETLFNKIADDVARAKALEESTTKAAATAQADISDFVGVMLDKYPMSKWHEGKWGETNRKLLDQGNMTVTETMRRLTNGEMTWDEIKALKPGVHTTRSAKVGAQYRLAVKAVTDLAGKYLPEDAVIVIGTRPGGKGNGAAWTAGNVHFISLTPDPKASQASTARTAIHEVGHILWHRYSEGLEPSTLKLILDDWATVADKIHRGKEGAAEGRFSITNRVFEGPAGPEAAAGKLAPADSPYVASFDEYVAEQFVKHIEQRVLKGDDGFTPSVLETIKTLVSKLIGLFDEARANRMLKPDDHIDAFFNDLRSFGADLGRSASIAPSASVADDIAEAKLLFATDPVARRLGLDLLPLETADERMQAKAMLALHKKAEEWAATNPIDEARLKVLTEKMGLGSTSTILLKSDNVVARYIASVLLESPTGAIERTNNAALTHFVLERKFAGHAQAEFQGAYEVWRKAAGGSLIEDVFKGAKRKQFNRLVAEEIEKRRDPKYQGSTDARIKAAADVLEPAYERMRLAQIEAKTAGHEGLPKTSRGYMPHRLSAATVRDLTPNKARVIHNALVDQFVNGLGWDEPFAQRLAGAYLDRARRMAVGGFSIDMNPHSLGGLDTISQILESDMKLAKGEIAALMKKLHGSAAGHTKHRLDIDLLKEFDDGAGGKMRLLEVYETDHAMLLHNYSRRVAGEVALAKFGIVGKQGMDMIRRAMEYGGKTENAEYKAFDQITAEFLGIPFGEHNRNVDRMVQYTSLARLGGMGFTQFAEFANGVAHVGVLNTLSAMTSFARLRREAVAIAKGQHVDGFLRDMEKFMGMDFGTENYSLRLPFGDPDANLGVYGRDSVGAVDKMLRGGLFLQGKLSFWRGIHAAQERGFAEQVTQRAMFYLREGKNDVALRDMGFTDDLMKRLRAELPQIAQFDSKGRLTGLTLEKATDSEAAQAFAASVLRGTRQIIQGTFVGETGAWAHNSYLKVLTQFRTFGLVSVEKQWARNVGNYGVAKAFGIMMGSMAVVAPVYMTRVAISSIGREDQDEYLDKMLDPLMIARQTMNYVSMSGLAGDFLDAVSAVGGAALPEQLRAATGGRAGSAASLFGGTIGPAFGVAEGVYAGFQNTDDDETNAHELLKNLPFNKLPVLMQAVNGLK